MAKVDNKTCERLEVDEGPAVYGKKFIFVKSVWEPTGFFLAISDGLHAWTFDGSEKFVRERADVWDKPVSWVMEKIQFYLSARQPDVKYSFTTTRGNERKLSFDIKDKDGGVNLTANLVMQHASDPENITCDLLGFLLDGNCQLSEKFVKKSRSFDRMKAEAEASLDQSKRFMDEKVQFEQDIYKKFVAVLNSKKRKLRDLREQLAKWAAEIPKSKEEDESEEDTSGSDVDDDESEHEPNRTSRGALEEGPASTSGLRGLTGKTKEEGASQSMVQQNKEASGERLVDPNVKRQGSEATVEANMVDTESRNQERGAKADPDATQPFHDVEAVTGGEDATTLEAPKEAGPSNAAAALLGGSNYTSAPRKRRRT